MSFLLFGSLLAGVSIGIINVVNGAITSKANGKFIGVYDDTNEYTWNQAQAYCQSNYGTDLASINSEDELADFLDAFVVGATLNGIVTYVGLYDSSLANQVCSGLSDWDWVDGSDYADFPFTDDLWTIPGISDDGCGEYCVFYWCYNSNDDCTFEDFGCDRTWFGRARQFVCNCDDCDNECGYDLDNECDRDNNNDNCDCDTDNSILSNNCNVCNNGECSQCQFGYFKAYNTGNYPCISCSDTFGDGCMFCQDYNGCGQCKTGYNRVYNEECGLYECVEDPCFDSNNHCKVCNNGLCSQCENGYVLLNMDDSQCVQCQDTFGDTCLHCTYYSGCQQCTDPSNMVDNGDGTFSCADDE